MSVAFNPQIMELLLARPIGKLQVVFVPPIPVIHSWSLAMKSLKPLWRIGDVTLNLGLIALYSKNILKPVLDGLLPLNRNC